MAERFRLEIARLGRKIIDSLNMLYGVILTGLKTTGIIILKFLGIIIGFTALALLAYYWLGDTLGFFDDSPLGVSLILDGFRSIADGIAMIFLGIFKIVGGIILWVTSIVWDLIVNLFDRLWSNE